MDQQHEMEAEIILHTPKLVDHFLNRSLYLLDNESIPSDSPLHYNVKRHFIIDNKECK